MMERTFRRIVTGRTPDGGAEVLADEQLRGGPGERRPDGPAPWGHQDVHASDTVDVIYLTSGTAWIHHPDGSEVRLDAGDVIVQHGTMHAWANHSENWATGIAFVVGARPEA